MYTISETVVRQPRSGIRRIMEIAQQIPGTLHLEVGEPLFPTPDHIVQAGCDALTAGFTKYAPNAGIAELRELIADRYAKELGIPISRDNVIVGIGGVEVINCAVRVICDPGDEILIPNPSWPNYQMMCAISSAVPVGYSLLPENGFLPDFDQLERLVSDKTKLLIINSPSNPLGIVFPKEVMEKLVAFAQGKGIQLISDEAYEHYVYSGEHVSALSMGLKEGIIGAYTFSKTYAMTGWRVGYAIATEAFIQQMIKLQEAYVSSVSTASQMAAAAAIKGPQDCVAAMRQEYAAHAAMAGEILDRHGIPYLQPSGAFYMWIKIGHENSTLFAEELVRSKQVAVAPGGTFGSAGEGYIRISLASPDHVLEEGVKRLAQFISEGGR